MAKIKFRQAKISSKNEARLEMINEIIEEYQADGYKLTLRQLYYQLVSRDVIPNAQSEYSKLSTLLKEGRMSGIVDWDAIEDRLRIPSKPASFDSPKDILEAAINQFKLPRQKGQGKYIEVWVEKDALSGVLKRVTEKYHINILVNRGYSSASAMFDSYERFSDAMNDGQETIILYLGDFDPSGLDMIRDINDRLTEFFKGGLNLKIEDFSDTDVYKEGFAEYYHNQDLDVFNVEEMLFEDVTSWYIKEKFKVIPIALTKEQIEFYNPPPNPAKVTDPRAKDFIAEHGNVSWEVDALKPDVLHSVLEKAILEHIDIDKYDEIVSQEEAGKKKLRALKNGL